jgi:hypothetical protein
MPGGAITIIVFALVGGGPPVIGEFGMQSKPHLMAALVGTTDPELTILRICGCPPSTGDPVKHSR